MLPAAGKLLLQSINWIIARFETLGAIAYGLLVFLIIGDVLGRFIFRSPIIWTYDVALMFNVGIGWLAAASILRQGEHIEVTVLTDRVSPVTRGFLRIVTSAIGVGVCILFTWSACLMLGRVIAGNMKTETWGYTLIPLWALITISAGLFGLQFVERTYGAVRAWRSLRGKGVPNG